jgi:hypothetical protein
MLANDEQASPSLLAPIYKLLARRLSTAAEAELSGMMQVE